MCDLTSNRGEKYQSGHTQFAGNDSSSMFEPLEPRLLLNGMTYMVNSLLDVVESDGVVTLREAIEVSNTNVAPTSDVTGKDRGDGYDKIIFDKELFKDGPVEIILTGSHLEILEKLEIDGPGEELLTINADGKSRIFFVEAEEAIITGLTLTNGHAENGGAVYSVNKVSIGQCDITYCVADQYGGGVFSDGDLYITSSDVNHNQARRGGGAWTQGEYSEFQHNQFTDNTASLTGGGIQISDSISTVVFNTNISNNTTLQPLNQTHGRGGGLYIDESGHVVVKANHINDNRASGYGGGFIINRANEVFFEENTISRNSTNLAGGGGYIEHSHNVGIVDSVFSENSSGDGGGLYIDYTTADITGSDFINNLSQANEAYFIDGAGGGIFSTQSDLTIKHAQITGNTAVNGGGIYTHEKVVYVGVSSISDNTALNNGGGVYTTEGNIFLSNIKFYTNTAGASGGAIAFVNAEGHVISGSVILGNTAGQTAGGIYYSNSLTGNITNSVVTHNVAPHIGGISHQPDRVVRMYNSIVTFNSNGDIESDFDDIHHNLIFVDPMFVRNPSPGDDNQWGTDDDDLGDLRLQLTSPAVDAGDNNEIDHDRLDINDNAKWAEPVPYDLDGLPRIHNQIVDIGAYEMSQTVFVVDSLLDVVEDDGVVTLREALEAASTNTAVTGDVLPGGVDRTDVITFAPELFTDGPGTITLNGKQLVLYSSIDLIGPGAELLTIDAGGQSSVIRIVTYLEDNDHSGDSIPVSISDLTLTGGGDERFGGGIYATSDDLTITRCVITANHATQKGSGIYADIYDGHLQLIDTVVSNNASQSNAVYVSGYYGQSSLSLINSTVSENSGGGLYAYYCDLQVSGSTIANNIGIGIYAQSHQALIENSTISGNSVSGGYGGGLRFEAGTLNVINSLVVDNAADYGGGIYVAINDYHLYDDYTDVTLVNTTVAGNEADDYAGGIYLQPETTLVLNNSIVSLNHNGNICGAVNVNNSLVGGDPGFAVNPSSGKDRMWDTDDDIAGDYHLSATSIAIDTGDNHLAIDSEGQSLATDLEGNQRITNNRVDLGAYEFQGIVELGLETMSREVTTLRDEGSLRENHSVNFYDGHITLREALIYNALMGGEQVITFADPLAGYSFSLSSGELQIFSPVTIDGEEMDITLDPNGQSRIMKIYAAGAPVVLRNLTLTGGRTDRNTDESNYRGGAIYAVPGTHLIIEDCTLHDNYADDQGGAIYTEGHLTLSHSTVSHNHGFEYGGGIFAYDAHLIDSTVSNNRSEQGGGVYVQEYNLIVERCTIFANIADHYGGGIKTFHNQRFVMTDSIVDYNTADSYAGGVLNNTADLVIISNSTVAFNVGGGLRSYAAILRITDSHFDNNSGSWGSGAQIGCDEGLIENSTFNNNQGGRGGGIYSLDSGDPADHHDDMPEDYRELLIKDSLIKDNIASREGGGIFVDQGAVHLLNTLVQDNQGEDGGGIYAEDAILRVESSQLIRNQAGNYGGAINADDMIELTVSGSAFYGNTAQERGGGISSLASGPTFISNSLFVGNTSTASYGGGIYLIGAVDSVITNCTLVHNQATRFGSLISGRGKASLYSTIAFANDDNANTAVSFSTKANNLVDADPMFRRNPSPGVDSQWGTNDDDYGDLRLQEGSPAIDAAMGHATTPAHDIEGRRRWDDPVVDNTGSGSPDFADIGAYEAIYGRPALEADFDGDSLVTLADLDILGANFGMKTGASKSMGDASGDGKVSLLDLDILGRQFHNALATTRWQSAPAAAMMPGGVTEKETAHWWSIADAIDNDEPVMLFT